MVSKMEDEKIELESLFFSNVDIEAAALKIKSLSSDGKFSYVVTPNIDHLSRILGKAADKNLQAIYKNASLSICDSRIIDQLLRLKGHSIKEVIPGSTLTDHLFRKVITPEDAVLIVGVEDHHISKLRNKFPKLNIQHVNPSMGFISRSDEVEGLLGKVAESNANYIFLSVGSPRQEILAEKMNVAGNISGVTLCVGASVLFLIDAEKRAPLTLQKLHLEWFYRMMQDPGRLVSRYFKNFLSLPIIFKYL